MSKKITLLIISLIILATLVVVGINLKQDKVEDGWICVNDQWVKIGNPTSSQPSSGCSSEKKFEDEKGRTSNRTENQKNSPIAEEDISVSKPQKDDTIASPYKFEGEARGTWFFEGSLPVKIVNEKGVAIGQGIAQALGEWMTEDFVPFQGIVQFSSGTSTNGFIVFSRDNPSGLPENEKEIRIPVKFSSDQNMTVKVFFNNSELDSRGSCEKVFSVERVIPKTQAVGKAAIEELLKGPTELEEKSGYFSNLNEGVKLKDLTIANEIAKVDFDSRMEEGMGGSCRVAGIQSSITETLKQFPTVKEVVISVEGQTEGILQP